MINQLNNNITQYTQQLKLVNAAYQKISMLRFLAFIAILLFAYLAFKNSNGLFVIPSIIGLIVFLLLVKKHQSIWQKKNVIIQLLKINNNELSFIEANKFDFPNGQQFITANHIYTNDLDVFGNASLYQYLNRTTTIMGATQLATALQKPLPYADIKPTQVAVAELATKNEFRQTVAALGTIANDSQAKYNQVIEWTKLNFKPVPLFLKYFIYISPIILIALLVLINVTAIPNLKWVATWLFLINVYITSNYSKQFIKIINSTENVNETIAQYALMLKKVENEIFETEKLKNLQQQCFVSNTPVSKQLSKLSTIVANIESVQNIFGAFIVNGCSLFHIHQLVALNKWKASYNSQLPTWLGIIGNIEKLNALANFSANNPSYAFPIVQQNHNFNFENLGHPLIEAQKKVCNHLVLDQNKMIILSGSNMSGKSTFLRTVGINLVLAYAGAPINAINLPEVGYMPLVSCMRLNDSLEENTSYFFAEVKRLQLVMEISKHKPCFVLLDEILRGTNSEDKKQGTIKVIEKLIEFNAIGFIASHDLEVCNWGQQHPSNIGLKCFENEVINNELYFDYKLKEGICKNKTATFLLNKMGVIN
jgi:hypothetical protein